MKHIAVTGNLGSGKSTVCRIFELLEIPVYYSDAEAKRLMIKDELLITQITKLLGSEAYSEDNNLNRKFISSKIFSDSSILKKMNALVHPAVRRDYMEWRKKQSSPFTLQESALTFEINAHKSMDYTIVVMAPEPLLVSRGMSRGNQSKKQIEDRLLKQMPQSQKIQLADYIIDNSLGANLVPQVLSIYDKIIQED